VEASQQLPPVFQAGVDLVMIDVQVTPAKDAPMPELTVADFDVSVSGRKRPTASATFLHYDEGSVTRDAIAPGNLSGCAFGFHRRTDRTTAHYLVGVEGIAADRKDVKQVRVNMVDKGFVVPQLLWRTPARRGASAVAAGNSVGVSLAR
jgi:hypothetical protein